MDTGGRKGRALIRDESYAGESAPNGRGTPGPEPRQTVVADAFVHDDTIL
jgi:hypothetical protein